MNRFNYLYLISSVASIFGFLQEILLDLALVSHAQDIKGHCLKIMTYFPCRSLTVPVCHVPQDKPPYSKDNISNKSTLILLGFNLMK